LQFLRGHKGDYERNYILYRRNDLRHDDIGCAGVSGYFRELNDMKPVNMKVRVPWQDEPMQVPVTSERIVCHIFSLPGENPQWIERSYPIVRKDGGMLTVDTLNDVVVAEGPNWPTWGT
jgi:hypothetical protein